MNPELYTIHESSVRLAPFVRRFMHVDTLADTSVTPAPTGYTYLGSVFNSGDIYIVDRGCEIRPSTGWHISGQLRNHDVTVCYRGHVGHLLAEFTPTGFYRLTGIFGDRATNKAADVITFSPRLAQALASIRLEPLSTNERLHAIEHCLLELIPQARDDDTVVASAGRMLENSNGLMRIESISDELGVSERQLCRRFRRIVGVTPKYFGQVRQINYTVEMLLSGDAAALTGLALEAGFYDQSHFVKAMHRFFGQGPRRFLNSRHSVLAVFIGASRRFAASGRENQRSRSPHRGAGQARIPQWTGFGPGRAPAS